MLILWKDGKEIQDRKVSKENKFLVLTFFNKGGVMIQTENFTVWAKKDYVDLVKQVNIVDNHPMITRHETENQDGNTDIVSITQCSF